MSDLKTNVPEFFGELGAGVVQEKLAHVLSECALAVASNDNAKKVGKIGIELTFAKFGEGAQVLIAHKISKSIPTKRGKRTEEDTTETLMYVGRGGVMTINPPREEYNGQFNLKMQQDGAK